MSGSGTASVAKNVIAIAHANAVDLMFEASTAHEGGVATAVLGLVFKAFSSF
jgi:hypothetical protein